MGDRKIGGDVWLSGEELEFAVFVAFFLNIELMEGEQRHERAIERAGVDGVFCLCFFALLCRICGIST